MNLDLTEEEWLTVMAALSRAASGKKVRDPTLQTESKILGTRIEQAIKGIDKLKAIIGKMPEPATELSPDEEPETNTDAALDIIELPNAHLAALRLVKGMTATDVPPKRGIFSFLAETLFGM